MMVEASIDRARQTQHGFTDLKRMADEIVEVYDSAAQDEIAEQLFASEVAQARMGAVFLWGYAAADNTTILQKLRDTVSRDLDWRVQEILAQAFDQYCKESGYDTALPTIRVWLEDEHPNVRRAVSEGLRIWTTRPYLCDHPQKAIALLSPLRGDDSAYVRKSVGNALRDISHKHADLVRAELERWDTSDERVAETYQLAAKFWK